MDTTATTTIDGYLAPLPADQRAALEAIRRLVKGTVPEAAESISYGIPTFKYRGKPLIYMGAAKTHLALYGTSKGTMRFQPPEPPADEVVLALLQERITTIDAGASRKRAKPAAAKGP